MSRKNSLLSFEENSSEPGPGGGDLSTTAATVRYSAAAPTGDSTYCTGVEAQFKFKIGYILPGLVSKYEV